MIDIGPHLAEVIETVAWAFVVAFVFWALFKINTQPYPESHSKSPEENEEE